VQAPLQLITDAESSGSVQVLCHAPHTYASHQHKHQGMWHNHVPSAHIQVQAHSDS
jgi:hypothetical protein